MRVNGAVGAKLLTLHLVHCELRSAPRAARAAVSRTEELRATPGLLHAQPFATSNLFVPTPRRLGLLCAWDEVAAADAFLAASPVLAALGAPAQRSAHVRLQPVRATGRWNGVAMSVEPSPPLRDDEPVLAFVHGRLRRRHAVRFYRANVRVARFALRQPGFLGGMGLHETPRRFASLSSWRSLEHAQRYAYGPGEHEPVVRPYKEVPWAEDWCFAPALPGPRRAAPLTSGPRVASVLV